MPSYKKIPVPKRVADYLGRNINPPEVIANPETGAPYLVPASYKFSGQYAEEHERIARAASAATGIVPDPDQLTAEAMAQLQAQQEQAAPQG